MSRLPGITMPPGITADDPHEGEEDVYRDAVDIQIAGRSNLYIADATGGDPTLHHFGEQMDDTPLVWREFFNDVPGDSHGGPQGPPIERQALGRVMQASFNLSTWSHGVRHWLERHNGAYGTNGVVLDYEIGTPLLTYHGFRLLIVPTQHTPMFAAAASKADDYFCYNFPACMISSPIECGQGTKFSALRFTMEAHRAPPQFTKRGVLWDRDITGLAGAQAAAQQVQRTQWATMMTQRTERDQAATT